MDYYSPIILKMELLSQGFVITERAKEIYLKGGKEHANIGAVGKHAIDIILEPGKVYVGVPVGSIVSEHVFQNTPFRLDYSDGKYFISKLPSILQANGKWKCVNDKEERGVPLMTATVLPRPDYYSLKTSRGIPMKTLMPVQGDFGGSTISPDCYHWGYYHSGYKHQGCRFCAIEVNKNAGRDIEEKSPEDFIETIREARKYKYFRHGPAFAGGTMPGPDRGALIHAKFIREIKKEFPDNWIRLSLSPPEEEKYVEILFESGVDLLTFNYEIYDPNIFKELCPAKWHNIEKGKLGHKHYDRIYKFIVKNYGKNKAYSNLILGLEPVRSTVAGIEHLASMGVIPCIFVFVPLKRANLQERPTPNFLDMIYVYTKLKEITEKDSLDTNCAGCQRMMVNTKLYDGIIPLMPAITERDLTSVGLPIECLHKPSEEYLDKMIFSSK